MLYSQDANLSNKINAPCCMSRKGTDTKAGKLEITTSNHQKHICYFKVYKRLMYFTLKYCTLTMT